MKTEEFKETVKELEVARDKNGKPLTLHSLLIKDREGTHLHHFRPKEQASDVRSISKSVLTLVLGRVIQLAEEGDYPLINEETAVFPVIQQQVQLRNKDNLEKLNKLKVKHLLTHTIGYDKVLMMRGDIAQMDPFSYLDYLVNYPIVYEPGEHYLYSNAGFYLLSVFLEEFIQEDLTQFLRREFFEPLGIQSFTWEKYGHYLAGATRLWLLPENLLKIGEVFLNHGQVKGKRFISESWLDRMLVSRVKTPKLDLSNDWFRRGAYGYGIWLAKKSFYFGHGTDGQRFIVLPEAEQIIILLAEQVDTQPIDQAIDRLIKNKLNEGAKE